MSREGDGWMREPMPVVSAWLDSLRHAFGREMIDEQIRRGLREGHGFWACENGHEFGKRGPPGVPVSPPPYVPEEKEKKR